MSDFFTDLSSVGTSSMGGDYKMERTVKIFCFISFRDAQMGQQIACTR